MASSDLLTVYDAASLLGRLEGLFFGVLGYLVARALWGYLRGRRKGIR
jgi:hypothetical protein